MQFSEINTLALLIKLEVPVRNLEKSNESWASAFECLQQPVIEVDAMSSEYSKFLAGLTEVHWLFGLHYVFKRKWNSKHKLPIRLKPTSKKAFRLWGDYLYTILELCIQCHAAPYIQISYPNAAKWFEQVAQEMKTADLNTAPATKGSKRETVDKHRELLKALKKYENLGNSLTHPHSFALVESARNHAQRSDEFCKKYWKPFIAACSELLQDMESNPIWQTVFDKDGMPYVQAGRGNRVVPYPGFKKSYKNVWLEILAL